jgi:F420-dependent oxidoreductase-like protein
MRVAIGVGTKNENWEETTAYVQEAERLGVFSVWSAEHWEHDAITPLAYLAGKTSRIMLGTGIMQAGTRTPALVAMTALSMQAISGNRFLIGLGASGPQVIEGWHGQEFSRTSTRMREIVEIVRKAVAGERVVYPGKVYVLPRPGGEGKALKTTAQPRPVPPIYLATLSPKSLEMTGEIADGWLGTSFIPAQANVFFDHIKAGAERAGRKLTDLDLQAGGAVAFGDDLGKLVAPRRPGLAFQLGAMGSRRHNFYNDAFKRAGYADVASEAQRLYLDGQRGQAAEILPDEMVLGSNLLGTEAQVTDRVRAYRDAGVTTLRAQPDGATTAERLETLGRLMQIVARVNSESAAAAATS